MVVRFPRKIKLTAVYNQEAMNTHYLITGEILLNAAIEASFQLEVKNKIGDAISHPLLWAHESIPVCSQFAGQNELNQRSCVSDGQRFGLFKHGVTDGA